MADLKTMADQLVSLTVKEVSELAGILKEEYGIEPAAAAVAVAAGTTDGGGDAGEEEKTDFDIMLISSGVAKLAVVKEVKNLLGVGLKDAKGLVDGAPAVIKEAVPKAEAESIKAALEGAGAEVELK